MATTPAREALFALRLTKIKAFFQHDKTGTAAAGAASRAAVTVAPMTSATSPPASPRSTAIVIAPCPPAPDSPLPDPRGRTPPVPRPKAEEKACLLCATRDQRLGQSGPIPYFGANSSHLVQNQAEFDKRKAAGACIWCDQQSVRYDRHHLDCPFHGMGTNSELRKTHRAPK